MHSPGGSPQPWRKQEVFLHGRKGSFLLRTELGELGAVPTTLPIPPFQCRVTVTLEKSPGRRQAWEVLIAERRKEMYSLESQSLQIPSH